MHNKRVLITGANRGVGFEVAKQLAIWGAEVVLVCKDKTRGENALEVIRNYATGQAPVLFIMDLSLQSEIHLLALKLHRQFTHLDVLINNAGSIFSTRELTADGIEKTFAINHLAPFLLTHLLLDLALAAPQGRIINITSESHNGSIDLGNLQGELRYNFFETYNRSKLCNILFTYELARYLEGTGVTVNCASPGPTKTDFGNNLTGMPALFSKVIKKIPFLFGNAKNGAKTIVRLASFPEFSNVTGKFFLKGKERKTKLISYDRNIAKHVWDTSIQLCALADEHAEDAVLSDNIIIHK